MFRTSQKFLKTRGSFSKVAEVFWKSRLLKMDQVLQKLKNVIRPQLSDRLNLTPDTQNWKRQGKLTKSFLVMKKIPKIRKTLRPLPPGCLIYEGSLTYSRFQCDLLKIFMHPFMKIFYIKMSLRVNLTHAVQLLLELSTSLTYTYSKNATLHFISFLGKICSISWKKKS